MTTIIFDAALKGTVLLVVGGVVAALLRKSSADLRHRVWLAALCGFPLLMVPLPVPESARVEVAYTFYSGAAANTVPGAAMNPIAWWSVVWALGAGLVLLRFLVGMVRLGRLTLNSKSTEIAGVRASAAISTPLTWGVFNPAILLPEYAADWSDEKRAMAVAHERAHIARGVWFWQSYAQVLTAIFWFHPLVWFAASRLRQEAEEAVDDAVLSSGAEAASYAQQLVEVARHMNGSTQAAAVGMVRHPALSSRIAAILDQTRVRTLAGVRSRVAIAVVALASVPVLAAFQNRGPKPVAVPAVAAAPVPMERPVTPAVPRAKAPVMPVLVAQAAPKPVAQPAPAPAPSSEPYPIGGSVSAPVPIVKPEPEVPEEAKGTGMEGEVRLGIVIDQNGIPTEISVSKSLDPAFDASAIKAVQQWRFKPGMKDGRPVAVRATISVLFHLQ